MFRAERRAGELLIESGVSKNNQHSAGRNIRPTLSDLGIDKHESSKFQKVASVPEVEFDKQLDKMKRDNVEITRQKLINVVNEAMKPEPTRLTPQPIFIEIGFDDPVLNILRTVANQADTMNMKEFRIWFPDNYRTTGQVI